MDLPKYSNKIAKGAIIVFLSMLVGRLLTYLYIAIIARLGSENYGLLSLGFAIISFLSIIALMGLTTGVIRYVSYYKGKGNKEKIKGVILSSIKISLPLSIILSIILFIFAENISITIFNNSRLTIILKLFSFIIPFIVLNNLFNATIVGFQKIKYQIITKEIIENSIKLILTIILIYLGFNLFGAIIGYIIAIVAGTLISLYLLQKKVFPFLKKEIKPHYITKKLFNFSLPLILSGFLVMIIKWTDVLMIGYFKTASEVGIYNVALPTANLLVLIPTSLLALFMPIITELYSKGKIKEIKKISNITSKWIFFLNLPLFFLIMLFSKEILRILFGEEYIVGYVPLIILLVGYLVHCLTHIFRSILNTVNQNKKILYVISISAIANIVLNYLLIPKIGIAGGAIATSSSFIISYFLLFKISYKFIKIQPININYFKCILAGLISTIIIYFIKSNIKNSIINIIFLGILFIIIYLGINISLKVLEKEDKRILLEIYKRFRKLISL